MSRIDPTLELICDICGWRPTQGFTMADIREHFKTAHDTDEVKLELAAFCSCGSQMRATYTLPVHSQFHDNFKCDVCGNEGFVIRKRTA